MFEFLVGTTRAGLSVASDKQLYIKRVYLRDMYCKTCQVTMLRFQTEDEFDLSFTMKLKCSAQGEPGNYFSAGMTYTLVGARSADFFYTSTVDVTAKVSLAYNIKTAQITYFSVKDIDFFVTDMTCFNSSGKTADTFLGPFINSILPEIQNEFKNSVLPSKVVKPIREFLEDRSNWDHLSVFMDSAGGTEAAYAYLHRNDQVAFDQVAKVFIKQVLTIIPTRFKFSAITVSL